MKVAMNDDFIIRSKHSENSNEACDVKGVKGKRKYRNGRKNKPRPRYFLGKVEE